MLILIFKASDSYRFKILAGTQNLNQEPLKNSQWALSKPATQLIDLL